MAETVGSNTELSSPALLVPRDRERQTFSLMTTLVLSPETKMNFVLSMRHHTTEVSVCEDRKSANILDDNPCKRDVDHLDEVIGSHNKIYLKLLYAHPGT